MSSQITNSKIIDKNEPQSISFYRLAIAMILRDFSFAMKCFLVLVLAPSFVILSGSEVAQNSFLLLIAQRFIELSVLYLITSRWIALMKIKKNDIESKVSSYSFFRLIFFGFLVWIVIVTPILMQLVPGDDLFKIFFLTLLFPGIYIWLNYYFYFIAIILGEKTWPEIKDCTTNITHNKFLAPFATILGPLALMSMLMVLISLLSPDGRLPIMIWTEILASSAFWILSTYLSIAMFFTNISEKYWYEAGFDPYREARLSTICNNRVLNFSRALEPKNAVKIFFVSLLFWVVNAVRLESMPPTAKIKVTEMRVGKEITSVDISAEDPEYKLRNFHPHFFVLAGNERTPLSSIPEKIVNLDTNAPWNPLEHNEEDSIRLRLDFRTTRSGDAMRQVEDVYLWYRQTKIEHLKLKDVKTVKAIEEAK
jgi:hypothetical protein